MTLSACQCVTFSK